MQKFTGSETPSLLCTIDESTSFVPGITKTFAKIGDYWYLVIYRSIIDAFTVYKSSDLVIWEDLNMPTYSDSSYTQGGVSLNSDSLGNIYVSRLNWVYMTVDIFMYDGSIWAYHWTPSVTLFTEIHNLLIDSFNNLIVIIPDLNHSLKCTKYNGATWSAKETIGTIGTQTGCRCTAIIDSTDTVHILAQCVNTVGSISTYAQKYNSGTYGSWGTWETISSYSFEIARTTTYKWENPIIHTSDGMLHCIVYDNTNYKVYDIYGTRGSWASTLIFEGELNPLHIYYIATDTEIQICVPTYLIDNKLHILYCKDNIWESDVYVLSDGINAFENYSIAIDTHAVYIIASYKLSKDNIYYYASVETGYIYPVSAIPTFLMTPIEFTKIRMG